VHGIRNAVVYMRDTGEVCAKRFTAFAVKSDTSSSECSLAYLQPFYDEIVWND